MKRILLAAALAAAFPVLAQAPAPQIPPPQCEPTPKPLGQAMRQDEGVRKRFLREVKEWEACMKAYLDERNAAMQANQDAANAAIKHFNETIKALNEAK